MQRSPEEMREIERHKYFLSERQGHDVGWEFAEQDWERHHAARWRREHLSVTAAPCDDAHAELAGCCSAESTRPDNGHHSEGRENGRHSPSAQTIAAAPVRRGPLLRLLSRIFQQAS
jgi:hypothetical protein